MQFVTEIQRHVVRNNVRLHHETEQVCPKSTVIYFTVEPKDLRRQLRLHLPPGTLRSTRSNVLRTEKLTCGHRTSHGHVTWLALRVRIAARYGSNKVIAPADSKRVTEACYVVTWHRHAPVGYPCQLMCPPQPASYLNNAIGVSLVRLVNTARDNHALYYATRTCPVSRDPPNTRTLKNIELAEGLWSQVTKNPSSSKMSNLVY